MSSCSGPNGERLDNIHLFGLAVACGVPPDRAAEFVARAATAPEPGASLGDMIRAWVADVRTRREVQP